jgi:hypothetical protein
MKGIIIYLKTWKFLVAVIGVVLSCHDLIGQNAVGEEVPAGSEPPRKILRIVPVEGTGEETVPAKEVLSSTSTTTTTTTGTDTTADAGGRLSLINVKGYYYQGTDHFFNIAPDSGENFYGDIGKENAEDVPLRENWDKKAWLLGYT